MMERREFLALSAAPVAAAIPLESSAPSGQQNETRFALAQHDKLMQRATKLNIEVERGSGGHLSGFIEVGGSFGACGKDEFADADGFQREQAESFSLIRELLTMFELDPAETPTAAEHGTRLNIDLYRTERLEGFFETRRYFGLKRDEEATAASIQRDQAESLALIRALLAEFERKPAIFKSNSDNKVSAI